MDTPGGALWLIVIFACLYFNGRFTVWETAILESTKKILERAQEDDAPAADDALAILEDPVPALEVLQIGLTLTSIMVGAGIVLGVAPGVAPYLADIPYGHELALGLTIFIVAFLSLLVADFLPKRLTLRDPETSLLKNATQIKRLVALASPLQTALTGATSAILTLCGINPHIDDSVTEDEVKELIEQGTEDGTFEKTEQTMVERIFHMSDQTAYSLMTPRTQLEWLDLGDGDKTNIAIIRESKKSRFIVGRDSLDEFCGILFAKDLLDAMLDGKKISLADYVRKPVFIPRSMEPFRVLEKFREAGVREGLVLDEYGGVIGLITHNDIIDELTVDCSETDENDDQCLRIAENVWLLEGLYSIDDFKERFNLEELPKEDRDHYQTMGGFLLSLFGYIPRTGEKCQWDDYSFEVAAMDRARIAKIRLTKAEAAKAATSVAKTA